MRIMISQISQQAGHNEIWEQNSPKDLQIEISLEKLESFSHKT